jgi:hypothetical protein
MADDFCASPTRLLK